MTATLSEADATDNLDRVQDAAVIAWAVWRRTDFDDIGGRRNLDDEFASRVRSSAFCGSVAEFADRLANRWGVRSLPDFEGDVCDVIHHYDSGAGDQRKFLQTVRRNNRLVVLEMKERFQNTDDEDGDEAGAGEEDSNGTDPTTNA